MFLFIPLCIFVIKFSNNQIILIVLASTVDPLTTPQLNNDPDEQSCSCPWMTFHYIGVVTTVIVIFVGILTCLRFCCCKKLAVAKGWVPAD